MQRINLRKPFLILVEIVSRKIRFKFWDSNAEKAFIQGLSRLKITPTNIHESEIKDPFLDVGKKEIDIENAQGFLSTLYFNSYTMPFILPQESFDKFLMQIDQNLLEEDSVKQIPRKEVNWELESDNKADDWTLAQFYRSHQDHQRFAEYAIVYLARACQKDPDLLNSIDLAGFLAPYQELTFQFMQVKHVNIFQKEHLLLLEKLAEQSKFKKLELRSYSTPDYVNEFLSLFIEKSTTLEILDLKDSHHFVPSNDNASTAMTNEEVRKIAKGLEKNNSIKIIDLSGHKNINDDGLFALLTAIQRNPQSKIEKIIVRGTSITSAGHQAMLKILQDPQGKLSRIAIDGASMAKSTLSQSLVFQLEPQEELNSLISTKLAELNKFWDDVRTPKPESKKQNYGSIEQPITEKKDNDNAVKKQYLAQSSKLFNKTFAGGSAYDDLLTPHRISFPLRKK